MHNEGLPGEVLSRSDVYEHTPLPPALSSKRRLHRFQADDGVTHEGNRLCGFALVGFATALPCFGSFVA